MMEKINRAYTDKVSRAQAAEKTVTAMSAACTSVNDMTDDIICMHILLIMFMTDHSCRIETKKFLIRLCFEIVYFCGKANVITNDLCKHHDAS